MPLDLDKPLLQFGQHNWTFRDSFAGTHIFGRNGSGKTMGSGRRIALALLKAGYGGLVLTVKPQEVANWKEYMTEAGRAADLLRVSPEGNHKFNFLRYEAGRKTRGGGLTQNITSLIFEAMNDQASHSADPYWEKSMRKLLGHAVELLVLARGADSLSLASLNSIIISAPTTTRRGRSDESFCAQLLREAWRRRDKFDEDALAAYERAEDYFTIEFPKLASKTRSIIVSCFTSLADDLLRAPHRRMFTTTDADTFQPELSHAGRVIVLDLPLHQFGSAGRFAQRLYKTAWQRAAETRDIESTRPLFLWVDEAHHFVTDADVLFATTAREYRVASVFLAQNLPNYFASFGARSPEHATEGFLGVLHTKVFHQNAEPKTNAWASSLWGDREEEQTSVTTPVAGAFSTAGARTWDAGLAAQSMTKSQTVRPRVPKERFTQLQAPEAKNGFHSQAVIYHRNGMPLEEDFSPRRT